MSGSAALKAEGKMEVGPRTVNDGHPLCLTLQLPPDKVTPDLTARAEQAAGSLEKQISLHRHTRSRKTSHLCVGQA